MIVVNYYQAEDYNPDTVAIFSAASCTTNAITPVLKVIEDTLGVVKDSPIKILLG